MVPLSMVVRDELLEYVQQSPFPEENQAVQTFLANRPHEPFRVGVGVRRLEGRQDDAHSRRFYDPSKSLSPLAVPVTDEEPMATQEPIDPVGETPRRLGHECGIGIGRRAHHLHPPALQIEDKERAHAPASRSAKYSDTKGAIVSGGRDADGRTTYLPMAVSGTVMWTASMTSMSTKAALSVPSPLSRKRSMGSSPEASSAMIWAAAWAASASSSRPVSEHHAALEELLLQPLRRGRHRLSCVRSR